MSQGQKITREEYNKIKEYVNAGFQNTAIAKVTERSRDVISRIKNSTDYEDYVEKNITRMSEQRALEKTPKSADNETASGGLSDVDKLLLYLQTYGVNDVKLIINTIKETNRKLDIICDNELDSIRAYIKQRDVAIETLAKKVDYLVNAVIKNTSAIEEMTECWK